MSARVDQSEPGRSADLDALLRWETAGGTWAVVAARPAGTVTIALCRCDGGEEVERLASADPLLLAHVGYDDLSPR